MTNYNINSILTNPHIHKWSLQGFGMLRMYLSETERLHIWHSKFKTKDVTTIHGHPWDFTSNIIAGKIRNTIYSIVTEYDLRTTTFDEQTIICGPTGCDVGPKRPVFLRVKSRSAYIRGESYSQKTNEIHDTSYVDGTITVVKRTFLEDTEHARVYIPVGEKRVDAKPREAAREEIECMTKFALEGYLWELNCTMSPYGKDYV